MQSPIAMNYAIEFPTFGEVTGVSTHGMQHGLALGKRPS